jgi:hypothetical protein
MAGRIAYYGNIVRDGLVLDLDAAKQDSYPGSGTVWRDIAGGVITGSLINGPTFDPSNFGSIVFDGVNDYVSCGNVLFNSSSATTIDIWVNFPSMVVGKYITSKGSAADGIYTFIMYTGQGPSGGGSSYIRFSMGNQAGAVSTNIEYNSLIWNQWYNFTFTHDSSFVTGYRNAATPTSRSLSGPLHTTTTPIYLGIEKYFLHPAAANISSFKIYNRALSAAEVLQNYNAQKGRYGL